MEINLSHGVTYQIRDNAPVSDVAASLLANEKLIYFAAEILEGCVEGLSVDVSKIKVKEVSNSSPLKELLAFAIVVKYQDDLDKEVPDLIRNLTGLDVPDSYDSLVTVLVMIAAIYAVDGVYRKIFPGKVPNALEAEYAKHTKAASDVMDISPEKVRASVDAKLGKKKLPSLIKAGIDFIRPSKRENATIEGLGGHEIGSDAIREVPRDVDFLIEDEASYTIENVTIDVHSQDRDYHRKGWAAVVKSVSDKRLKMDLIPSIDPDSLWGKTKIVGDIVVMQKKDDNGDYVPKSFYLTSVSEASES